MEFLHTHMLPNLQSASSWPTSSGCPSIWVDVYANKTFRNCFGRISFPYLVLKCFSKGFSNNIRGKRIVYSYSTFYIFSTEPCWYAQQGMSVRWKLHCVKRIMPVSRHYIVTLFAICTSEKVLVAYQMKAFAKFSFALF